MTPNIPDILEERRSQVVYSTEDTSLGMAIPTCDKPSVAGSVSQRACVFCGSRVVLYPIADAIHIVHGPIGCAGFTWDIRGALSSGPELHRKSFSTNLEELDIIFGAEKKLHTLATRLISTYKPQAVFIYATCIIGLIGDDVDRVCRILEKEHGIPVIPVHSEGFKGVKKDGYRAACMALLSLMERSWGSVQKERDGASSEEKDDPSCNSSKALSPSPSSRQEPSINLLGEFNLAGEGWLIKSYYERLGIRVVSMLTGDGRVADVRRAPEAALNLVQCSGSMVYLAKKMEEQWGIPWQQVSFFGVDEMARAIYGVAEFFRESHPELLDSARALVREELSSLLPLLEKIKPALEGKRVAIYVGGGFKAWSLVRILRDFGMRTVVAGSQTGSKEDYEELRRICEKDTVLVDDSNPLELGRFIKEKQVDLLIGGVKERPVAYKMGIGFCDHNHERKIPLAGFIGVYNFAFELYQSITSPVWDWVRREL
ncbi:MAG: nitrogenase iron-molybdenum cofactor biosynthesis protein NifE [Treponemataceae bacterium]|nr:nitrogenase iron-molybdenum cofactor biosynthesis protein NifE [Treponemataceae bacterium]